jgi:tripartite-type tricarboxylate transporter receptor subunit TctC
MVTFIRKGRAKVPGVAGPKRQTVIPNVPTLVEQVIQGADHLLWIGLIRAGALQPD